MATPAPVSDAGGTLTPANAPRLSADRTFQVVRVIVRGLLILGVAVALGVILVEERRQTCFARAAAIATSDAAVEHTVGAGGSVTVKYVGPGVREAEAGGRTLRLPGNFEHTLTCK